MKTFLCDLASYFTEKIETLRCELSSFQLPQVQTSVHFYSFLLFPTSQYEASLFLHLMLLASSFFSWLPTLLVLLIKDQFFLGFVFGVIFHHLQFNCLYNPQLHPLPISLTELLYSYPSLWLYLQWRLYHI